MLQLKKYTSDYIVVEENDNFIRVLVPPDYNPLAVEELRFFTNKEVEVEITDPEEFNKLLQEKLAEELQEEEKQEGENEELSIDLLKVSDESPTVKSLMDLVNSLSCVNFSKSSLISSILVEIDLAALIVNLMSLRVSSSSIVDKMLFK